MYLDYNNWKSPKYMTSFLLDGSERLGQFRRGSFLAEGRSLALAFCYTHLTGVPDCRIAVYWNSCVFSCLYFSLPLLPVEFSHRQPWDRKRTFTIRSGKMATRNDDKKAYGPITVARFSLSTCSISILLSEFNCVLCWRAPMYSAVSVFRLNVRWKKEVYWCTLTLWVRIGGLGFGIVQFEETFWLRRSIWDLDMKRKCSYFLTIYQLWLVLSTGVLVVTNITRTPVMTNITRTPVLKTTQNSGTHIVDEGIEIPDFKCIK